MAPSWWQRSNHEARRSILHVRSRAMRAVRRFFHERDFIEVDTPALQRSPGVDRHIKPMAVQLDMPLGGGRLSRFLHSSPEFAMKKLLAAGEDRIFQLCHVFRDGEAGVLHQPEFTLLEWYRTGATYTDLMSDVEALIEAVAGEVSAEELRHGERTWSPSDQWQRLTVAQAFKEFTGIDVLDHASAWSPDGSSLRASAVAAGVRCDAGDTWDDVFHRVLLERIDPELAKRGAVFLYDYPYPAGALARQREDEPSVCERVEAYICGVELANGFTELNDSSEQRHRFDADRRSFQERYGTPPPVDEDFLAALTDMPDAAGMALGIDRLVMLLTGAPRITDVQWAPVDLDNS